MTAAQKGRFSAWERTPDGYRLGNVEIFDNGAGLGPAAGGGRWAVEIDGKWFANIDTLREAKTRGLAESAHRAIRGTS